jgi:transmembrane 9 superfamily protein 3
MDESGKSAYIWTHKKFEVGYNGDRIVDVNLTSESKKQLQPNTKLEFSYEVIWKPSNAQFADRFNKYLDPGFFQHKVKMTGRYMFGFDYIDLLFRFIGFRFLIHL